MEIEGHPTQDLIEERERRGAIRVPGTSSGPNIDAMSTRMESLGESPGTWLFLSPQVFDTGFDELPA